MFLDIINPKHRWLWLSAPTRYGKTEILAMGLIYLAVVKKLKLPIVAGTQEKANKIMEYVLQHLPDYPSFYEGLINLDVSDIEKLKVRVSKDILRWQDGGWIYITSIESRNILKEGENVVGEGGDVVILEEAGLIKSKEQFSKVVRMPEEDKGWGKLIMSGNCIENSVFQTAFNNPLYHKVKISLEQSIAEGRFTQEYLDDKKEQTTSKDWKRYYLVEFPEANEFTYFKPQKYEALPPPNDSQGNSLWEYIGALDPSLGETAKASLAGIVILGKYKPTGQIYEVSSIGDILKPNEQMNTIFNYPYKFKRFGIESVQFQKYFKKIIEDRSKLEGRYIPFEGLQQRTNKTERIESLEPYINTGQILFKGDNLLWEHMQDYPNPDHLDVLDALEMAWRLFEVGKLRYAFI